CEYTTSLYDLVPLQAVQWLFVVMSAMSIGLICYTARHYLHMTIFDDVTKELIIALYVYIAIYALCLFTIQLTQLIYRYIASEKCEAQLPKTWCILRYCITMLVVSLIVIHVGITVQHMLSTFLFGSRVQKIFTRIAILISFLWPVVLGAIAYRNDSLEGRTAYCSGITAGSAYVLSIDMF
ncbi:hypothetical protein PMAYCL1PPCAC_10458, partial [Pristionchus mayeri]